MRYGWPVDLLEEPEGVSVTCPDVPELVTCGTTVAKALDAARDALVIVLSLYTDDGRPLPAPSAVRRRPVVTVPVLVAAKLALHQAMIAAGVSNVDPLHGSKIEAVEAAPQVLGRQLEVVVRPAV
jgi:antitoxin HicB